MKLNQDKCHLIVSGRKYENVIASAGESKNWEYENQKTIRHYYHRQKTKLQ